MNIPHLPLAILCAVLLGGCMTQRVVVVDTANRPITGAAVEPISLSINYAKETTDSKGKVALPHVFQRVVWVSVTKEGYEPSGHVAVGNEDPIVVTLSPTK